MLSSSAMGVKVPSEPQMQEETRAVGGAMHALGERIGHARMLLGKLAERLDTVMLPVLPVHAVAEMKALPDASHAPLVRDIDAAGCGVAALCADLSEILDRLQVG